MIAYDLRCKRGHVFEAWFRDRQSYIDQKAGKQVECPECGSKAVEMVFTGCAIQTEGRKAALETGNSLVEKFHRYLEKNFEDVGERFAEEARRIHYEETARRNIRGVTTIEEEKDLREEGVDFVKIPLPKLDS